jgi:outer membrane protein assembly factor BamB
MENTMINKRTAPRTCLKILPAAALTATLTLPATAQRVSGHGHDAPGDSQYGGGQYNGFPEINVLNARYLRRSWETFNDDTLVFEPAPTGFVLEEALGLIYPAPVVGEIAPPAVRDGTVYYVDQLGTLFARNAQTGQIDNLDDHWTTSLVDPDFNSGQPALAPELFYVRPIVTDDYVWLVGSFYGQVHLVDRVGGFELDFDPTTPEIDPFQLVSNRPVSSVLGDPVIVDVKNRTLLVVGVNVILNDALFQDGETGLIIAYDITDPLHPVEAWRRRTIDTNPATGFPYSTGVSAVSGLVVDEARGMVYGGLSQNTSFPYPEYPDSAFAPEGYIDRGDSLYAIDLDTGEFVWTNQFHAGDVFDLNDPVSTGPHNPGGPRDADVLAQPVLFSARVHGRWRDLVGDGSKGGLFRVVDRDSGETMWERQISKPTGIGGIQGGAAFANGVVYVAGFEGIDDGFSDSQFGVSLDTGLFPNAFFATFSPAFWADVEDVADDGNPATGMRVKVYALDARTGRSLWRFRYGQDFVSLDAGASLRHVSVAGGVVFVATSSGQLFALNAFNGHVLFSDQTPDLNDVFDLGLGKPQHASMNGGTVVADGMVYAPAGAQNNPSGGLYAYEVNRKPRADADFINTPRNATTVLDVLANDSDPNGDALWIVEVANVEVIPDDGVPDVIHRNYGTLTVFNPGDDPSQPDAAYIEFDPAPYFWGIRFFRYTVQDMAPNLVINGFETDMPNPTHTPREDGAWVRLRAVHH